MLALLAYLLAGFTHNIFVLMVLTDAHTQYPLRAHERFNLQCSSLLLLYIAASVKVLTGDANNRTAFFGGASTSNLASLIKPF